MAMLSAIVGCGRLFLSFLPRGFSEGAAVGGGGGAGTAACCCRCFFLGSGSFESPNDGQETPLSTRGAAGGATVGTFQAALVEVEDF